MKKVIICLALILLCSPIAKAAHGNCTNSNHSHHSHTHSSNHNGSSSNPVYLINREQRTDEIKFPECDKHYAVTETTTNYYSDGTKRIFTNSTIYNSDGSVLVENCKSVKHVIYNGSHYFLVNRNKGYQILDDKAQEITTRKYTRMEILQPDRILVRFDKKYGIIDLSEKTIVPIKYQDFEEVGHEIFLTKLNGYWGLLDIDNNQLVKNDCEKIKPAYDTFILKRYGKYGLADKNGNIILNPTYDKIKKLGEYILVKRNRMYGVLDFEGKNVSEIQYKSIKIERNTLKGLNERGVWVEIKQ